MSSEIASSSLITILLFSFSIQLQFSYSIAYEPKNFYCRRFTIMLNLNC